MIESENTLLIDNQLEIKYSKSIALEHRKKYAQFFTPLSIASLMVDWLIGNISLKTVLEPAFGLGIFSRILLAKKSDLLIKGFEIDKIIFSEANEIFSEQQNVEIHLEDYMYNDWNNQYDGVICNPPYFKFHDYDNKLILSEVENQLKIRLNGFTNLYTLFLLKSIHQLKTNGRLAYIVPSEFLNSDYGKLVKSVLIQSKILRHIVVFNFKENIFDDVLTTASILFCSKDQMFQEVKFSSISKLNELSYLKDYISNYPNKTDNEKTYLLEELDPKAKWRRYYQNPNGVKFKNLVPFSNVAKVVRGIATGANDYFTFSKIKAERLNINKQYLLPCICKSVDVKGCFFTKDNFFELVEDNRPAYLLNAVGSNDRNVKKYLEFGEKMEIHKRYLTASRNPWYLLENRTPAPIWVSVFNRNGLRFIRNEANISNLTTFHCIYPESSLFNTINIDILFAYLITDVARQIFEDNRREYGNGLQKFEPNDVNKAMMLDLSLLSENEEKYILNLYQQYRKTVIAGLPQEYFVNTINEVFLSKYSHVS
ncbi:MAG TPA: N-6 DNA methylase [Tenuifilaceae bacterium]|nr:N-6 DNA methylase [Tenuifilaceae bacterium]